ncbi:MAG: CO dehydrogenase/acetyl-CoA synthase complex subunit epsilon [Candidatus Thorarchaeota archaeon]|nr:MAG: CO dehydrogenase/acetyl-CoA synthase complex subunit epsilon [Candidatus Thorarchaeota archaeon]
MMRAIPWQTGEICGPDSAKAITKAAQIERDIKKAKKPVLVIGSEALTQKHRKGTMVDYAIEFSKAAKIPIIATGNAIKAFLEKGFDEVSRMGAMELAFYLQDPEWTGPKGNGPFDLILVYGIPYYMQWTLLSAVMNFGDHMTAITLGRHYQPHAKWSFPNMKENRWHDELDEILKMVGGGK